MSKSFGGTMKTVKIGGIPHKIILTDDVRTTSHDQKDGSLTKGEISYLDYSIRLWKGCPPEAFARTFMHEILHGVAREYRVPMVEGHEEDIVDQFASGVVEALESLGIRIEKTVLK
jgi:hypothetical protein